MSLQGHKLKCGLNNNQSFLSVLEAKDDQAHPTSELILSTHIQF